MKNNYKRQRSDYVLSLIVFGLIAFGLIMIYSVSKYYSLQITNEATDKYYLIKQLSWAGVGLVAWLVVQAIDYRFWQKNAKIFFYATIVLLILPIVFGSSGRWVYIGPINFQPAELAKLTLVIFLASFFAHKSDDPKEASKLFPYFIIFAVVLSVLMLLQKDLGTLSVMVAISAVMFMIAGAPKLHLFLSGGLGVFLVWLAIKVEPYRMERFLTFLNPDNNVLGAGYHIRNALIAIGSGGLWGLGFGQSKQKYLYLPEAHTDSIFAIISEELGLVRSLIIVLAFVFLALRGYRIAMRAPDTFSRLVATGVTTWLFFQMFVNIAAMLSLLPLTGIPLPLISYGGSSLLVLLIAIGILINISKYQVYEK